MTQPLLVAGRTPHVLLVEDNEDHAFFTREAFTETAPAVVLHHVTDGEKCMAFLRRQGAHANAPVPDLVLLDINMPRMDGHEVMRQVFEDPALRSIPVVVLTTSAEDGDIRRMYEQRCSSYIVKSLDFEDFSKMIGQLTAYWFECVVLVPQGTRA